MPSTQSCAPGTGCASGKPRKNPPVLTEGTAHCQCLRRRYAAATATKDNPRSRSVNFCHHARRKYRARHAIAEGQVASARRVGRQTAEPARSQVERLKERLQARWRQRPYVEAQRWLAVQTDPKKTAGNTSHILQQRS